MFLPWPKSRISIYILLFRILSCGISASCFLLRWSFKSLLLSNAAGQKLHLFFFVSVLCRRSWARKLSFRLNFLSQNTHVNSEFSCVFLMKNLVILNKNYCVYYCVPKKMYPQKIWLIEWISFVGSILHEFAGDVGVCVCIWKLCRILGSVQDALQCVSLGVCANFSQKQTSFHTVHRVNWR